MEEEEFDFSGIVDPPNEEEFDFSDVVDEFDFTDVVDDKEQQSFLSKVGDYGMAAVNNITQGIYGLASSGFKMIGALNDATAVGDTNGSWNAATALGETIDEFITENNPDIEGVNQTYQDVAQGVGQGLGMLMTGSPKPTTLIPTATAVPFLGQATVAAAKDLGSKVASVPGFLGGSMTAVPEWEAAKASGASDDEAFNVLLSNYLVGQSEALPIQNLLGRLNKVTGNRILAVVKNSGIGSIEEATQEAIQTYLSNQIAQESYDPDRDPLFQVIQSAKVGGIVGFILPGVATALQSAPTSTRNKVEKLLAPVVSVEEANQAQGQAQQIIDEVANTGDPEIDAQIDESAAISQPQKEELVKEQITQDVEEKQAEEEKEFKATESEVIADLDKTEEEIAEEKKAEDIKETPEYKDAVQRVADLSQELQNPDMSEEESREVYGRLAEAKNALRKIAPKKPENSTNKKTPIKKRIEDTTGVTKPEKSVKMTPNEAIKHQVQTFYKGVQEGVYRGKDLTNDLVTKVQEAIKDSPLNPKQVSTILTKVRKTNLFTPGSISKLNTFIDKVSEDAVYADKISEARSTISAIKKSTKNKDVSQQVKGLAKIFASINPEDVDIDKHLNWATQISNGLKSPTNPNYKIFNVGEAQDYIEDIQSKQAQAEAKEIKDSELRGETRNVQLFANLTGSLEGLRNKDTSGLDPDEVQVVENLRKLNPQTLTNEQATKIARVVDNILENDDFSGAVTVDSIVKSKDNLKTGLELQAKTKEIRAIGRMGANTYQQFARVFGKSGTASEIQRLSGILDLWNAGSRVENQENNVAKRLKDKVKSIRKRFKIDPLELDNQVRLVIFSEIYKNYGDESHIPKVKKNFERTAKNYEKTDERKAEVWKKIIAEFKDVNSGEEALAVLNRRPGLYQAWQFVNDIFNNEIVERHEKVNVEVHNKPYARANNYTHTAQVNLTSTKEAQEEFAEDSPRSGKINPDQSKTSIKATRTLRDGYGYESDFFTVQLRGYRQSLYDIEASRAEALVRETIYTPEFEELVGSKNNADVIRAMVAAGRKIQKGVGTNSANEVIRFANSASQFARNIGTVRALASFSQPLKQSTVMVKTFFNHAGTGSLNQFVQGLRTINMKEPSPGLKKLWNQYTIGVRGQRLGGIEKGETVHLRLDPGAKKMYAKWAQWLNDKSHWFQGAVMSPLTKSDIYVARATWNSYYLQSLKEQGVTSVNMDTEFEKQGDVKRQKAAAFAEQQIAETQVPSNPATLAQISRNESDTSWNVIKNVLLPFSMFSITAKYRNILDVGRWLRNPNKQTSFALAGSISEMAAFGYMAYWLLPFYKDYLRGLIESLFDLEEGGDDEKDEKNKKKSLYTNLVNSASPFAIGTFGESGTTMVANALAFLAENPDMTYEEWKKEGGFVFEPKDNLDWGIYGLGAETMQEVGTGFIDMTKSTVLDEPITYTDDWGRKHTVELTEGQKKLLAVKTLIEIGGLIGINEADIFGQIRRVYKEQLKLQNSGGKKAPNQKIIIK
jgi:hypothetical protein